MPADDGAPPGRQEYLYPGQVRRLTRDDIAEGGFLDVICVFSPPPGGAMPTPIHGPKPITHIPPTVGGGVSAYVIDPRTLGAHGDVVPIPMSILHAHVDLAPAEPLVADIDMDGLFEELTEGAETDRFILLVRDRPEHDDG